MEPMDFDSFVTLINEMTEAKKVESPLSQLTSEELALIKAFDPDLVDEICAGKIAPSEAVLLARSATSNQEQEHVVKENASECASSALCGIFEAAEQRLENNREEAKKLKEEADAENSDEGISDEEWEEDLDKKYEEIYNGGKLSPNIADQVDLSNPKMHFKSAQDSDVQYVMDNDIPCAFWDYDEDWVEAGLLHAIDGMGNFIKDDETVWVHCAILDNVKKSSFNPECPLDDVEDYKNIDESEDEIIVEEELYFVPELKGKLGKIWQGEPTADFNEAYEQALAECYMHEDSEIVVRDSLNRNVLDEGLFASIGKNAGKEALKSTTKTAGKEAVKQGEKAAGKGWFGRLFKKGGAEAGEQAAKQAGKGGLKQGAKNLAKDAGKYAVIDTVLDLASDAIGGGVDAVMNALDAAAQQGSNISGTTGSAGDPSKKGLKLTA